MSALSRFLIATGLISLFHAAYSAHEHSLLSQQPLSRLSPSLPTDIKLETLLSISLALLGLVLGSEPLRPISWSTWAGKIEKETGGGGNPFATLEDRVGFMDIRAKRKEFADWVRQGGNVGTSDVKS